MMKEKQEKYNNIKIIINSRGWSGEESQQQQVPPNKYNGNSAKTI